MNTRKFRGEFKFSVGIWTIYLFWPCFVKTNEDFTIRADTRFFIKWSNFWTQYKIGITILGFGIGLSKQYRVGGIFKK